MNIRWMNPTIPMLIKLVTGFVFVFALAACTTAVPPVRSTNPVWSPDGRLIAYQCYEDGPHISSFEFGIAQYTRDAAEICVMDINGQNKTRLTHNSTADVSPIWSPDGHQIAFIGSDGLYVINSDGTNLRHLVEDRWITSAAWSPDGRRLAFGECQHKQPGRFSVVDNDGKNLVTLTDEPGLMSEYPMNAYPTWSPNGLQLAYASSKGGCDTPADSTLRLKVLDIPSGTSRDVLSRDLYGLRDVSWLTADEISLAFNESAAIAWRTDLYIVNVTTGDIIEQLFGGMRDAVHYAMSHDRASIAYSTPLGEIYTASSSFDHIQEIWNADDTIFSLSWSPDDQFLLVNSYYPVSGNQNRQYTEVIWLISRDGSSAARLTNP
jgi:Tol biopolymer transport system component